MKLFLFVYNLVFSGILEYPLPVLFHSYKRWRSDDASLDQLTFSYTYLIIILAACFEGNCFQESMRNKISSVKYNLVRLKGQCNFIGETICTSRGGSLAD